MRCIFWITLIVCVCPGWIFGNMIPNVRCPCRPLNECPRNFQIISKSTKPPLLPCESENFVRCCELIEETVTSKYLEIFSTSQVPEISKTIVSDMESEPGPLRRLIQFMRNKMSSLIVGNKEPEEKPAPFVKEVQVSVPLELPTKTTAPSKTSETSKYSESMIPRYTKDKNAVMLSTVENYPGSVGMNILKDVKDVMAYMKNQDSSEFHAVQKATVNRLETPIRVRILNHLPTQAVSFPNDYLPWSTESIKAPQTYEHQKNTKTDQSNVGEKFTMTEKPLHVDDTKESSLIQSIIEKVTNFESMRTVPKKQYLQYPQVSDTEKLMQPFPLSLGAAVYKKRSRELLNENRTASEIKDVKNPHGEGSANISVSKETILESTRPKEKSNFSPPSKTVPEKANNFFKQKMLLETLLALNRVSTRAINENLPDLMSNHDVLANNDTSIDNLSLATDTENIKRHIRSNMVDTNNELNIAVDENHDLKHAEISKNSFTEEMKTSEVDQNLKTKQTGQNNTHRINRLIHTENNSNTLRKHSMSTNVLNTTITTNANQLQSKETTSALTMRFKRPPRILPRKPTKSNNQKMRPSYISLENSRRKTLDLLQNSIRNRKNNLSFIINRRNLGNKRSSMSNKFSTYEKKGDKDIKDDTNFMVTKLINSSEDNFEKRAQHNIASNRNENLNLTPETMRARSFPLESSSVEAIRFTSMSQSNGSFSVKYPKNRTSEHNLTNATSLSSDTEIPLIQPADIIRNVGLSAEVQPDKIARLPQFSKPTSSSSDEQILIMDKGVHTIKAEDNSAAKIIFTATPMTSRETGHAENFSNNNFNISTKSMSNLVQDINMNEAKAEHDTR